jgi:prepilin-type N-terminal cleavage/methylation domain-containing protein
LKENFRRRNQGFTLIELLISASILAMVLAIGASVFVGTGTSFKRGLNATISDDQARVAIDVVTRTLRESVAVSIDPDGMGVSYRMPAKMASGDLVQPVKWDGVQRRFFVQNGNLMRSEAGKTWILIPNVMSVLWIGRHNSME